MSEWRERPTVEGWYYITVPGNEFASDFYWRPVWIFRKGNNSDRWYFKSDQYGDYENRHLESIFMVSGPLPKRSDD